MEKSSLTIENNKLEESRNATAENSTVTGNVNKNNHILTLQSCEKRHLIHTNWSISCPLFHLFKVI